MANMVNNCWSIFYRRNSYRRIFNILVWCRSFDCNGCKHIYIKYNNSNNWIFATKPFVKKFVDVKKTNTNVYSIIGKKAFVIKNIDPIHSVGQIKINGEVWTAESENNQIIEEGSEVEILEIKGVKAIVKPVQVLNKV